MGKGVSGLVGKERITSGRSLSRESPADPELTCAVTGAPFCNPGWGGVVGHVELRLTSGLSTTARALNNIFLSA